MFEKYTFLFIDIKKFFKLSIVFIEIKYRLELNLLVRVKFVFDLLCIETFLFLV